MDFLLCCWIAWRAALLTWFIFYWVTGNDKIWPARRCWYENVSFKGEEHMKRELYDFTTPPDSKGAHASLYYFPHNKQSSIGLQSRAPAYNEPPCMVANYDKEGNLLYTRFIFKDGTWRDE
jgi:hypothetical protein